MRFVVDDVKLLVGTICLQISHQVRLQGPHQPLFLIWGIFDLTRISFKLLALQNPIIGAPLNILLCSLSGVKRRCILVIMVFKRARRGWDVILRTDLSSFPFFVWLLSSSVLENFLAFETCFQTNLSLYPLPLSQISSSLHGLSKNEFSERILFSL